jgi:hypothetical protein
MGTVRIQLDQVVTGPGDGALVGATEGVARQRGPGASRDAIAEVADRDGLEGAQR